jgi:hypothetical protein
MKNQDVSIDKDLGDEPREATSDKTLSDIEEDQKVSDASGSGTDTGPSPDGQFDESDENVKAGPM